MDTVDALAAKAHIHAFALRLRRAGMPGPLDRLRLLVFSDLTAGRDPLNRLTTSDISDIQDGEQPADGDEAAAGPPDPTMPTSGGPGAILDYNDRGADDEDDATGSAVPALPAAPMPAMINLVVHAGTLFGWDTTPSEAGGWGLLDAGDTRAVVAAASQHPATRWCFTLLARDGTAVAHGCAPGRHSWERKEQDTGPPGQRAPTATQLAQLAAFLRCLNPVIEPIVRGACDHATTEPRYTPSRKLAHLVRARTATCDAPGCSAQAVYADLDHTIPYPNGPTDQCNLGPKCRRHHKAKQSPGWKVEQPEPGITRWTLPNGRTHTTKPTVYSLGVLPRSCHSAGPCARLAGSCIRGGARWRLRRLRVGPTAPRPRRLPCR